MRISPLIVRIIIIFGIIIRFHTYVCYKSVVIFLYRIQNFVINFHVLSFPSILGVYKFMFSIFTFFNLTFYLIKITSKFVSIILYKNIFSAVIIIRVEIFCFKCFILAISENFQKLKRNEY